MIRNYISTLLRNLLRQKEYSILNLCGLALGMAACIIILLYVATEYQYDRFHSKADRVYRVVQHTKGEKDLSWVGGGMAPMLRLEFPEFEKTASISPTTAVVTVWDNPEISHREERIFFAEPELTEIFDFTLVAGSLTGSLDDTGEVIITRSMAQKYFPYAQAVGQSLKIGNAQISVTAVIEDFPKNSHFHPDILVSMATFKADYGFSAADNFGSFWWPFTWTYVLVKNPDRVNDINNRLAAIIKKHRKEPEASEFIPSLQPVQDIHLYSDMESEIEANGNIKLIYLFASVAFFLLLLACVNFMNLSTARAIKRSKEVGVRKVIGAKRSQLIFQFMGEAVMMSTLALILSLVLAEILLPFFNSELNLGIYIPYQSSRLWLSFGALIFITSLLAGIYPAFFLSSFKPIAILKSSAPLRVDGTDLRKTLVVFQFSVSITLIICATIAYYQIDYLRNEKLGFDTEHVVVLDQLGAYGTYETTIDKLSQSSSVKAVAGSNARPGMDHGWGPFNFETTGITAQDNQRISQQLVSYDFFELFDVRLVAGRFFDKRTGSDVGDMYMMRDQFPAYTGKNVIINESAARFIGKTPEEAIGQPMRIFTEENGLLFSDYRGTIVGVIKDYHSASLRDEIKPTVYQLGNRNYYGVILVKLETGEFSGHLKSIEKIWKEVNPDVPLTLSFLEEDISKQYKSEERLGIVISAFSFMVLLVACLGLFGLSAYTAELKTKEIGIRKVMGASTTHIVGMLSREFLMLLIIAIIISAPVGWYAATFWLSEFAYKIDITIWYFVLAACVSLVVALVTISWQSLKAAVANPVDSLRNE